MSKRWGLLVVACIVPLLAGCAKPDGFEIVPVEGSVTMNGTPLEKISLRFIPTGQGPESRGISDAQGHFKLETIEADGKKPQDGAVVGLHKVVIIDTSIYTKPFRGRASEMEDLTEGKLPRISVRYGTIHSTQMEISVTGETKNLEVKVEPFDPKDPMAPRPAGAPKPETPYER